MLHNLKDVANDAPMNDFRPLDLTVLAQTPPRPIEYALQSFAPKAELTLFTGPGSSGKSLLAQQLVTCAAAGIPMLGQQVERCKAIYATCEDAERELHWRQKHICDALDIPMASLADKLSLISLRGRLGNELCTYDTEGRLTPSEAYNQLVQAIISADAKLVALDNVGHLFTGNENDRGQVTQFANLLNKLAGETGAAIVLLAHPNKSGDTYSGSTAWLNAVRSQMMIDSERDADGAIIDPDARTLTLGKANYARQGTAITFRWHNHAFVLDAELPSDYRQQLAETIAATKANEAFLACLHERIKQGRPVSECPGPNYAPTQFVRMPEAKKISKEKLIQAMDRLFRIGRIERGYVCWDAEKRREKHGIFDTENPPQTPAPNAPQTPAPNQAQTKQNLPQTHTYISKDISGGGASLPPAPVLEERESGL